jgi:hypothetical protein
MDGWMWQEGKREREIDEDPIASEERRIRRSRADTAKQSRAV